LTEFSYWIPPSFEFYCRFILWKFYFFWFLLTFYVPAFYAISLFLAFSTQYLKWLENFYGFFGGGPEWWFLVRWIGSINFSVFLS
jgi:hypothetical protein